MQAPPYPMVNHNPYIKQRSIISTNQPSPFQHQLHQSVGKKNNHTFSYRVEEPLNVKP